MTRYGFYYEKNLVGNIGKIVQPLLVAASATVAVGDMVKNGTSTIGILRAGANANILGVVEGFESKGRPGTTSPNITYTAATIPDEFTATANNLTTEKVMARVILTPYAVYSNEPDGTYGTDTQGDIFGCYTDIVANSDQVDEDTAATSEMQLQIVSDTDGFLSDDKQTVYGLYIIHQSQLWVTTN